MNRTEITSKLEEIKALADAVLRELRVSGSHQRKGVNRKPERDSANSLSKLTLAFRDRGFFAKPRTAAQVHDQLKSRDPCDLNRVAVALIRLQERRQLRKTLVVIDGKKRNAYVW